MHSTFSRARHSRTIFAPVVMLIPFGSSLNKKTTVRGLFPPPSGQNSMISKSGRSGGAGYTDPNNNELNETQRNDSGREPDAAPDSLVGFRGCHRCLS